MSIISQSPPILIQEGGEEAGRGEAPAQAQAQALVANGTDYKDSRGELSFTQMLMVILLVTFSICHPKLPNTCATI